MRRIDWSDKASEQLANILIFWAKHNHSTRYSEKLLAEMENSLSKLSILPELGKPSGVSDIRMKLVRDYWVFYKYTDHEIYIIQISSTYQHPKGIYKDLK
ncbi:MAG TPA: type II toxin-antitoxin system RelE/ParE family toxin [Flavipsychrobacter sp.]|nr:type II toxin-antitoxin system RelE/ParE family toxin [Flavipsychrobacter sp.]